MAAIPIVLYQNTAPLNHARRTFNNPLQLLGTPREELDPLYPDITVEYNAAILAYNYAYIAEYGRYYYFTQIPTIEGKKIVLHLHADAFYNYLPIIMKSQCIANRSSSLYDLMVEDSAVLSTAGYYFQSVSLPYEFTPEHGTYILTVAGGQ